MTITDKITDVIQQYNSIELASQNLDTIMNMRKTLVALNFELGKEVAKYKRDYDAAYARRKIGYYTSKNEAIENAHTATHADVLAEKHVAPHREEEKRLEGIYSGSNIIRVQANECINAMQQDISILKTELNG